ncbi:hypothetical protein JA1_000266 [Spathaspora sp. JA1]|nr:hypothetical protein JA1_000266 [Spathaspora sp. JA1]
MGQSINTSIEINATPEKVREFFLNYRNQSNWNPFFKVFEKYTNEKVNELHVGDQLKVVLQPHGKTNQFTMYPTIASNNSSELKWKGGNFIFWGIHSFNFEPIDGGSRTKFVHGEVFGGLLLWLVSWMGILRDTELSFNDLNAALKEQVESLD